MSVPLLRDVTEISFFNITHLQHYHVDLPAQGLLYPEFSAFFSLLSHDGSLIYVSETTIAARDARFGPFSLAHTPKNTFNVVLSLWICPAGSEHYDLFLELRLDLRNLIRIYPQHTLADNAPLWTISNSVFGLPSHCGSPVSDCPSDSREKPSYTVDDIRLLGNLSAGVSEFERSKKSASLEINAMNAVPMSANIQQQSYKIDKLATLLAKQAEKSERCRAEIAVLRNKCKNIDTLVNQSYPHFKSICTEQLDIVESRISPMYETLRKSIYPDSAKTVKSHIALLETAYPIELLQTGRYCIVGLEFPTSIREMLEMCYSHSPVLMVQRGIEPEIEPVSVINSALSYIVSLASVLASILNIRLKHQMVQCGSRSYIYDSVVAVPVAADSPNNKYPLYHDDADTQKVAPLPGSESEMRNVKFEAGLALLKTNLIQLSADVSVLFSRFRGDDASKASATVPPDCQDNFLWLLHFLLLYVTAD